MNVQQLIDVLQKVEDKNRKVCFSYEYRVCKSSVNVIDLNPGKGHRLVWYDKEGNAYPSAQYRDTPLLILRGESKDEYDYEMTQPDDQGEEYDNETIFSDFTEDDMKEV